MCFPKPSLIALPTIMLISLLYGFQNLLVFFFFPSYLKTKIFVSLKQNLSKVSTLLSPRSMNFHDYQPRVNDFAKLFRIWIWVFSLKAKPQTQVPTYRSQASEKNKWWRSWKERWQQTDRDSQPSHPTPAQRRQRGPPSTRQILLIT